MLVRCSVFVRCDTFAAYMLTAVTSANMAQCGCQVNFCIQVASSMLLSLDAHAGHDARVVAFAAEVSHTDALGSIGSAAHASPAKGALPLASAL